MWLGVEVVDRVDVVRSNGGNCVGVCGTAHCLAPAVVVGGLLCCAVFVPGWPVVR